MKTKSQETQEDSLQQETRHHLHQIFISMMFKSRRFFHHLVLYSFLIGFGFGLGFLLNFHMRNVSFSPQLFRLSSPSLSPQLQPQPENLVIANETVVPEGQKGHSPVEFEKVKHHIMTEEEELMWRALEVQERPSTVKKKVAFMFLTRGKLPLAKLWERFFNGHQGLFSVYVHTSNLSYVDDGIPETSPFYRRRIPSKVSQFRRHLTIFIIYFFIIDMSKLNQTK